jgi:hypothetical protein
VGQALPLYLISRSHVAILVQLVQLARLAQRLLLLSARPQLETLEQVRV